MTENPKDYNAQANNQGAEDYALKATPTTDRNRRLSLGKHQDTVKKTNTQSQLESQRCSVKITMVFVYK